MEMQIDESKDVGYMHERRNFHAKKVVELKADMGKIPCESTGKWIKWHEDAVILYDDAIKRKEHS